MAMRRKAQAKPWKDMTVIQSWPRPRGRVKSARQQAWVDRFALWACLTKNPDAQTYDQAKEWTKDSGWFWRDMMTSAMAGKLIEQEGETKIITPTCYLRRSTTLNLIANTEVSLGMESMSWDNNGFWTPLVQAERMLFKSPGLYLIGAQALYDNTATDKRCQLRFRMNGTANFPEVQGQDISNNDIALTMCQPWYFHANEYIELRTIATQNCGLLSAGMWCVAITPESILP